MTGLSSELVEHDDELCLSCNMRCGGQVVNGRYNVYVVEQLLVAKIFFLVTSPQFLGDH